MRTDNFDHLCLQSLVKHVTLVEVVLEIGTTGKDKPRNIDFVVRSAEC